MSKRELQELLAGLCPAERKELERVLPKWLAQEAKREARWARRHGPRWLGCRLFRRKTTRIDLEL